MNNSVTDSLLSELKNLNKDLKDELKKNKNEEGGTITPTVSSDTSTTSTSTTSATPVATPFVLDEDNLNEFIFKNAQRIIEESVKTIKELQPIVATTFDSKLLEGYAEVVKATTGSIDTLNKLNIEKHKSKTSKEIKTMEIESKKEAPPKTQNTVNIIATREEVMKILNDNLTKQDGTIINVDANEIDDSEQKQLTK